MDARIAFGGDDDDLVQTKAGLSIAFGGIGADKIIEGSNSAGALVFGGAGADTISTPTKRNLVFGQGDNDSINVFVTAPDERDFVFGGGGSDTVARNPLDKKDAMFSAIEGSVTAPSAPIALEVPLASAAGRACPTPNSIKGFTASVKGGVGSSLPLAKDIHDYPDKNDTAKPPAKN